MRNVLKSMFRFSWAMSLFSARQAASLVMPSLSNRGPDTATAFEMVSNAAQNQMGSSLKSVYETGDQLQSGVLDFVLRFFAGGEQSGRDDSSNERGAAAPKQNNESAPLSTEVGLRGQNNSMSAADSARSIYVGLNGTTQGPFWPPSEVVDQEGNFILIGGFILTEISPGKVVPIPNERGVIVSKDTRPPLRDGKEDFSNPFGASYQIIRELDLGPNGKDWRLLPCSLSAGPFVGDFGGGRPRVPAAGQSRYNLNANPLWNKVFLPVGHEQPHFHRPSYRLDQVPILRLDEIPRQISVGLCVNNNGTRARSAYQESPGDFRRRQPITLREFLAGQGRLSITPLPSGEASSFTGARFDFSLEGLLPHSLYGFWALHAASLLAPTDPNFILPVPLAVPNLIITDKSGSASASFELQNPFPDPAGDAVGNRLVAIALIYYSDFQNWGAAISGIATGVNAHTVMSANFSNVPNLFVTRQPS
jgi:hypothetical protein